MLAGIFGDLLARDQIGIHDNFFELGGHSLLATQVALRVQEELQVYLPVRAIFEAPTVAMLNVAILQNVSGNSSGEELAQILAELQSMSDERAEALLGDGLDSIDPKDFL